MRGVLTTMVVVVSVAGVALAEEPIKQTELVIPFVKNRELFVARADGSGARQLTNDGVEKFQPVLSPSGRLVVYQSKTAREVARSRLVVVDMNGKEQFQMLIDPVEPNVLYGWRGPEVVLWLSEKRIVLEGSINPWNCEYNIVDFSAGGIVQSHLGDCGTISYSPDGEHAASVGIHGSAGGMERRDYVVIDGDVVYPRSRSDVRIIVGPIWAPDGRRVGIAARTPETGEMALVVVGLNGSVIRQGISVETSDRVDLHWIGGRLMVRSGASRLSFDPGARQLRASSPDEDLLWDRVEAEMKASADSERSRREIAYRLGDEVDYGKGIRVLPKPAR